MASRKNQMAGESEITMNCRLCKKTNVVTTIKVTE
jgi:hypothetical protein